MMWLIVLGWLLLQSLSGAAMLTCEDMDCEQMEVTFPTGANWACTVYEQQVVLEENRQYFPNGKYAPRHCWALDEDMTSYQENWAHIRKEHTNWRVWAEIQYDVGGGQERVMTTNILEVHR